MSRKKQDGGVTEEVAWENEAEEVFIPAEEPVIVERPDVQFVFDSAQAERWLTSASARLQNVYQSVRFDPEGMPENQIRFLLFMAARSIMKEYTLRDRSKHQGVFWAPKNLVVPAAPELADFFPGEQVGEYIAFYKE